MIWIMGNLDAMYSKKLNLHQNTLVMFSSDNGITFDVGGANADYLMPIKSTRLQREFGKRKNIIFTQAKFKIRCLVNIK